MHLKLPQQNCKKSCEYKITEDESKLQRDIVDTVTRKHTNMYNCNKGAIR